MDESAQCIRQQPLGCKRRAKEVCLSPMVKEPFTQLPLVQYRDSTDMLVPCETVGHMGSAWRDLASLANASVLAQPDDVR